MTVELASGASLFSHCLSSCKPCSKNFDIMQACSVFPQVASSNVRLRISFCEKCMHAAEKIAITHVLLTSDSKVGGTLFEYRPTSCF
jgi:hypothetical protein